ncbi:hypothetical protein [Pseudoduganella aquatica]|uniref:hypothetical protein n=1 Tax=Pseudoduganella aquatica TaxID=2660641 RepID=UPI001E3F61C0|nr:hypothetical protein [Pseudoduganella aquatica]
MLAAVAPSGIVEWGGDPAVLDASQWLDVNTALAIAEAFRVMVARRQGDLHLKVQRAVYAWGSALSIHEICDDLGRAFGRERIFVEWPTDRRPRRAPASSIQGVSVTSTQHLQQTVTPLVNSLNGGRWGPPEQSATITVATLNDLLTHQFRSELLIIVDTSREALLPHLDMIRTATGSQCAIFLPAGQPNIDRWLQVFGTRIAGQKALDLALKEANEEVSMDAVFLASTQIFMVQSARTFFPRPPRARERNEQQKAPAAVHSSEVGRPAMRRRMVPPPNLEIAGMRMEAPPPIVRVMDARIEHNGEVVSTFPLLGSVEIQIRIQPMSPLKFGAPAFPEQSLTWHDDQKALQVHLTEVGAAPRSAPLVLPRSGPSTPVVFTYKVAFDHAIDIRFLVCDGACVLQTARLQGAPGQSIQFFVEAFNSPLEHHKQGFDVSLLVNNSLGNTPSATVLTSKGIRLAELDVRDIGATREQLRSTLRDCVEPTSIFSSSLFNLANYGKILMDELRDLAPEWPSTITRVQLTTPSNVYFPVEYLYDGNLPANEDAGLCDQRSGCLTSGVAIENCPIRVARQQLCPMGFLGVTSVIERQTWDKTMDRTLWLRQAGDLEGRNHFTDLRRALFAASDRADEFDDSEVQPPFTPTRTADIEVLFNGHRKYKWQDWAHTIASVKPKLLVLVPHFENDHLYIGNDDKLALGSLQRPYIGDAGPIVVAIGCNTAIGLTANSSLPARLLREGAKVVIAALTSVLGRYANIAAADLTAQLMAAAVSTTPITIGELITRLRREFLAKDNALGMVLIAFGDADACLGESPA